MPTPTLIGGVEPQSGNVNLPGRTYLFYGPFGSGKTRLAATAMNLGRCLWIISDGNTDAMLLPYDMTKHERVYIHRWLKGGKDGRQINRKGFKTYVDIINDIWANDGWDFDFIIIDSLTTFGDMCMDMVLGVTVNPLEKNPEIQQWGKQVRYLMSEVGQALQEFTKNTEKTIIALCHDRVSEDKKTHKITTNPGLTGQAGRSIGKEYEEVYYLESIGYSGKASWQARTRASGNILAQTKIPTLPDLIPAGDLDMKWILDQREAYVKKVRGD